MKISLLAAAALLTTALSTGPVFAAAHVEATGGATCADLNGMDSASATAYLQGYQAGRQDAMMSASAGAATDTNTAGTTGDAAAAAGEADTTASGGTSTGVDSAASTGGDAAGGTTGTDAAAGGTTGTDTAAGGTTGTDTAAGGTTGTDTAASGGNSGMSAGGEFDANAIITACQSNPTGTLSDAIGGGSGSM